MPSAMGPVRDAVAALALEGASWRRFTLVDDRSDKFWRARGAGRYVETWWGRNGTQGQTKIKELSTVLSAAQELDRLIDSKIRKGYVEEPRQSAPAPRPPARPQVDPLSGRVAVYAQRDVLGAGGVVIHRRGFMRMLRPVDAAEVCTGSENYGYGNPMAEAIGTLAAAAAGTAETAGRLAETFRETSRVMERLPHIMIQPGNASRVPLVDPDEDQTMWGVAYQGSVFTGTARYVLSRITNACTNRAQEAVVIAKLRELIARGGGRDRVMSDRGSDLGEITASREPAAAPRNITPAPITRPSTPLPAIQWRPTQPSPAPSMPWGAPIPADPSTASQKVACVACEWSGRAHSATRYRDAAGVEIMTCPRCGRTVLNTSVAPPPICNTGSVALGRFTGLDDDEEEI